MEPISEKSKKQASTDSNAHFEQAVNEIRGKIKKDRTPGEELGLTDEQYQKLLNKLRKEVEAEYRAERKLRKKNKKKLLVEQIEEPAAGKSPSFTEIELDLKSSKQKVMHSNLVPKYQTKN